MLMSSSAVFHTNDSTEHRKPREPLNNSTVLQFIKADNVDKGESVVSTAEQVNAVVQNRMASVPPTRKSSQNIMSRMRPKSSKIIIASGESRDQRSKLEATSKRGSRHDESPFQFHEESAPRIAPLPLNSALPKPSSTFEIVVIGSHGSGASSVAARFVGERVDAKGSTKVTHYGDTFVPVKVYVGEGDMVSLGIRLSTACGIIYVCDSTRAGSSVTEICHLKANVDGLRQTWGLLPAFSVLIANKHDGACKTKASEEQVRELVSTHAINEFDRIYIGSALTGLNVEHAFSTIINSAASRPIAESATSTAIPTTLTAIPTRMGAAASGEPSNCVIC